MPDDSAPSTKYFRPASVERTESRLIAATHVERQAHQLEAEIERDQVGRRDQHAACRRSRAGSGSDIRTAAAFSTLDDSRATSGSRRPSRRSASSLRKRAKPSTHEAAAEGVELPPGSQTTMTPPAPISSRIDSQLTTGRRALAAIGAEHQQHHGADAPARSPAGPAAERGSSSGIVMVVSLHQHGGGLRRAERRADSCSISCATEAADMSSTGFGIDAEQDGQDHQRREHR